MRSSSRLLLLATGLAAAGLIAVNPAFSASTSAANARTATPSLTVALSQANALTFSPVYIAQLRGYFAKQGVSVNILEGTGSNTLNLIVSGQADLALFSSGVMLTAADKGQNLVAVYANPLSLPLGLVTKKSITSLAQLKAKKGCRFAAIAPGSITYGFARVFISELHLSCSIVVLATPAAEVAAVESGSVDAADVGASVVPTLKQSGVVNVLLNPANKAVQHTYSPYLRNTSVTFGTQSDLASKRAAVVKYLRAFAEAQTWLDSQKNGNKAAHLLSNVDAFKGQSLSALTTSINQGLPVFRTTDGYITPSAWKDALHTFTVFGIPNFTETDAANAYGARVDMSFYRKALPVKQLREARLLERPHIRRVLRVRTPTWNAIPSRVTYHWKICAGSHCRTVSTSTHPTLRVKPRYAGRTIQAIVTASIHGSTLTSRSSKSLVKK